MNYAIYRMYVEKRKTIEILEVNKDKLGEEELSYLADLKLDYPVLDEMNSEYARRYKMEQEMFKSFTPEQKDFICAQIGWWYLMWKEKMWKKDKPNKHWLGIGKQELKTMICGE